MDWQQIAVYGIVAGGAAYLARVALRQARGGCGGCTACPAEPRAESAPEEPPALVQLELRPPAADETGEGGRAGRRPA